MANTASKFASIVQSLRFRDIIIIFMLVMIALPVWLTWRIVESPEKLGALIELQTGHRVLGTALSCQIIGSRYSSRPSFQVIKELQLRDSETKTAGLYVEFSKPIEPVKAREICSDLIKAEKVLIDNLKTP